jgi:hypothetical protein
MTRSYLDRLPSELRDVLIVVGRSTRGLFGTAGTQRIFDENLELFERLYRAGANHWIVSQMLHDVGVRRDDGSPLPVGTVSSAISRARLRAAVTAAAAGAQPIAAAPGSSLQAAADGGMSRRRPAGPGNTMPRAAGDVAATNNAATGDGAAAAAAGARPIAAVPGRSLQAAADSGMPRQRPAGPGNTLPRAAGNSAATGDGTAAGDGAAAHAGAVKPAPPAQPLNVRNTNSADSAPAEPRRTPPDPAARNAGQILNQLRNRSHHGETN